MALAIDAGLRPPAAYHYFEVLKPYRSEDMAHFMCLR